MANWQDGEDLKAVFAGADRWKEGGEQSEFPATGERQGSFLYPSFGVGVEGGIGCNI